MLIVDAGTEDSGDIDLAYRKFAARKPIVPTAVTQCKSTCILQCLAACVMDRGRAAEARSWSGSRRKGARHMRRLGDVTSCCFGRMRCCAAYREVASRIARKASASTKVIRRSVLLDSQMTHINKETR